MLCEHEGCENAAVISVGAGAAVRGTGPEAFARACAAHADEAMRAVVDGVLSYPHLGETLPKHVRNRLHETTAETLRPEVLERPSK